MVGNACHGDVLVVAEETGGGRKLHGQRLHARGQLALHSDVGVGITGGIGHGPRAIGFLGSSQVVGDNGGDASVAVFRHGDGHLIDTCRITDKAVGGFAAVRDVADVGVAVLQLGTVIRTAGNADDAWCLVVVAGGIERQLTPVAGIVHHI